MSVAFNLLISTASLDVSAGSHAARSGNRCGFQHRHELRKVSLELLRLTSLVARDEVCHRTLHLQCGESLRYGFVIDCGEEERGFNLAGLDVINKLLWI